MIKGGAEAVDPGQFHVEQQRCGKTEAHGQHDEADRINGRHFQRLRPAVGQRAAVVLEPDKIELGLEDIGAAAIKAAVDGDRQWHHREEGREPDRGGNKQIRQQARLPYSTAWALAAGRTHRPFPGNRDAGTGRVPASPRRPAVASSTIATAGNLRPVDMGP